MNKDEIELLDPLTHTGGGGMAPDPVVVGSFEALTSTFSKNLGADCYEMKVSEDERREEARRRGDVNMEEVDDEAQEEVVIETPMDAQ